MFLFHVGEEMKAAGNCVKINIKAECQILWKPKLRIEKRKQEKGEEVADECRL